MEKRNIFSAKFEKKSNEELKAISTSNAHQEAAKLAAIWELERRGDQSEEMSSLAEEVEGKINKRNEEETKAKRYQTNGPRFIAAIIDGVLLMTIVILFELLPIWDWSASLISFISLALPVAYSILMHARFGQTLGKMALSIKLLNKDEKSEISIGQAVLRSIGPLVYVVSFILNALIASMFGPQSFEAIAILLMVLMFIYWCWGLVEIVTMLFDEKSRALHDYIAGTVVIRE